MVKAPDAVDKNVGNLVRMRRLLLDLTQAELAKAIGVSFQQVQKYEKGTNRISASRLQQIADLLRVPPQFFFERLGDNEEAATPSRLSASHPSISEFVASAEGLRLIKAFTQIKQRSVRKTIIQLLETLSGG